MSALNCNLHQTNVIDPILYLLYAADIPVNEQVTTAVFADDTAVIAVDNNIKEEATNVQSRVKIILDVNDKMENKS